MPADEEADDRQQGADGEAGDRQHAASGGEGAPGTASEARDAGAPLDPDDLPDGVTVSDQVEVPVEPGSPSLENALFVLAGAFVALAVVVRLVQLLA